MTIKTATQSKPIKKIIYNPYPHQFDMHKSIARIIMLMMPARSGKDIFMLAQIIRKTIELYPIWSKRPDSMTPKWHIWLVAPTFPLAKQLWRDLKAMLPKELIVSKYNESSLSVPLISDGLIEVRSASDPDKLVGSGIDCIGGTECGLWKRSAWELLKVRLSSPEKLKHSFAVLNGTPQGQIDPEDPERMHWQWEMTLYGRDPANHKEVQSFYWFEDRKDYGGLEHPILSLTTEGKQELESARSSPNLSERQFRQNYLGECMPAVTGRAITPEFRFEFHVGVARFDPKEPLYRLWDFGRNYPCVTFHQLTLDGQWIIHREYCPILQDMTDEELGQHITLFTQREFPKVNMAKIYDIGDFEATHKEDSRRETTEEMLRKKFGIGLITQPTRSADEKMAIDIIKGRLKMRPDGSSNVLINPQCILLIKCLQGMWTYEEYTIKGHKHWRDNVAPIHPWIDLFDTIKYFVVRILKDKVYHGFRRVQRVRRKINPKTGLPERV